MDEEIEQWRLYGPHSPSCHLFFFFFFSLPRSPLAINNLFYYQLTRVFFYDSDSVSDSEYVCIYVSLSLIHLHICNFIIIIILYPITTSFFSICFPFFPLFFLSFSSLRGCSSDRSLNRIKIESQKWHLLYMYVCIHTYDFMIVSMPLDYCVTTTAPEPNRV